MFIAKTTKYAFFGLCCLVFSFLLLTLSGCNATSDPRPVYQPAGSWQGTIGTDQVQGIIAPDRTYQLAIIDAEGNPVGAYVGVVGSIDAENIGSMTLIRLHTTENAGAQQQFTFKLSADRLFSFQGIELARTAEANGPAVPSAVAGHWSLAAADNFTDVVVNADGAVSGGDGVNCRYSGTLNLLDPAWNIYSLNMTLADIPGGTCNDSDYSGLAMILPPENERRRVWFAANNRKRGGVRTLFGEWSETVNVAPVAEIAIIGEREDQIVQVQRNSRVVELDAQLSTDANNDSLIYTWSGTDPDGNPLEISAAGSAATFVPIIDPIDPNRELSYSITLTVDDGIDSDTVTRAIRVLWMTPRFIDCKNGTVLDNSPFPADPTIKLIWLKNAGCPDLHGVAPILWWVNQATAVANVNSLAAPSCGLLIDEIPDNPWRLPLRAEFETIMAPTSTPPALVVGGIFDRVGFNPYAPAKIWVYWTSELVLGEETLGYYANFENYNERSGSMPVVNNNAVWPVRTASEAEVLACQLVAP